MTDPHAYRLDPAQALIGGQMLFVALGALVLVPLVLIVGVGGMSVSARSMSLQGIGLSGVVGVFLNIILPRR